MATPVAIVDAISRTTAPIVAPKVETITQFTPEALKYVDTVKKARTENQVVVIHPEVAINDTTRTYWILGTVALIVGAAALITAA